MGLKPCPFCGAKAESDYHRHCVDNYGNEVMFVSTDESMRDGEWRKYYVRCTGGRCLVWPSTRTYASLRSAVRAWNRRKG